MYHTQLTHTDAAEGRPLALNPPHAHNLGWCHTHPEQGSGQPHTHGAPGEAAGTDSRLFLVSGSVFPGGPARGPRHVRPALHGLHVSCRAHRPSVSSRHLSFPLRHPYPLPLRTAPLQSSAKLPLEGPGCSRSWRSGQLLPKGKSTAETCPDPRRGMEAPPHRHHTRGWASRCLPLSDPTGKGLSIHPQEPAPGETQGWAQGHWGWTGRRGPATRH